MIDKQEIYDNFEKTFKVKGERYYFSPGRINLIGEHTDYNGGKVFPCAITMGTYAVVTPREDTEIHGYSENLSDLGTLSFQLEHIEYKSDSNWTNYIKGMLLYIQEKHGALAHGFNLYIYGNIPNGAGLSSSASIEILTGVIVNDLYGLNINEEDLSMLGMRVENEFLNLNTGIMDQFVIANAKKDYAMLLDTNSLKYKQIPLNFPEHKIIIMNSKARRELVDSEYNLRREQCEQAVKILQESSPIEKLGDLSVLEFERYKETIGDEVIRRRAKHAVYENERTEQAAISLLNNDLETFGKLMNESHLSLHDDYEVTIKETDLLVRLAWEQVGVIGARMTGGGFGGSCIAIVENESVETFIELVDQRYQENFGYAPDFYIAESENKASRL